MYRSIYTGIENLGFSHIPFFRNSPPPPPPQKKKIWSVCVCVCAHHLSK